MNIYEIAKKANVSIATVSRVINNNGYVSKNTREKILKIVYDNNYKPSKTAQNLSTGTSFKLIGIICYNIEDLYYAKAVAVLEKELRSYGYDIILCCTGESKEQRQKSVDMLISKNVDAIILIGSVFAGSGESVIKNAAKHLPVFIINALVSGKNIYCAYCDESETIAECVKSLYDKSRNKLLFIYDVETYGSSMKLKGFKDTVKKLELEKSYILKCDVGIDSAYKAFDLFKEKKYIDGIVCANDIIAAGILKYAINKGIKIPEKLSVIGYNNSIIAECTYPKLTSLENNVKNLSVFTAQNLNNYFNNKDTITDYKTDFKLILRETI